MIEDMKSRDLGPASQKFHIRACKRFAAWLGRSPETATPDDVKDFQGHLIESGASICNRNRIMTGVKFLFRVTLRRHDLAAEIFHLREPKRVPLVLSQQEIKRLLMMAPTFRARTMLSLAYGCGLRASEVTRLKVGDIDSEQGIIRVVQSKGKKDRNVIPLVDAAHRLPGSGCQRRCWISCGNGGKIARAGRTLAFPRLSAGCSQAGVAMALSQRANSRASLRGRSPQPESRIV